MTLHVILLVLAVVCFTLAAFKVSAAVDWTNAGYAFVAASFLV